MVSRTRQHVGWRHADPDTHKPVNVAIDILAEMTVPGLGRRPVDALQGSSISNPISWAGSGTVRASRF